MKAIKQRPFAFSCVLFSLLLFISFYASLILKITILILSLLFIFILQIRKQKYRFLLTYLLPPIILCCIISSIAFSINLQNIMSYADKEYQSEFIVLEENTVSDNYSSYVIQLQKIGGNKVNFKANLSFDGKLDAPLFSLYTAKLKFSDVKNFQDGSSFNYSCFSKGIYLSSSTNNINLKSGTVKLFPSYYFHKINSFFSNTVNMHISGEENHLIQALILGNKSTLKENTVYNFRVLGLSHMLAVSGMHLSILIGSIGKLLEKLNISKKKRCMLMIGITLTYAGITGFSPSVKRAALMLIIYYASFLLSRNSDSITALCTALAIICVFSPNSVFDIGLWLSFLSTYGILQVAQPINEKLNLKADEALSILKKIAIKLFSMLLFGIVPIIFSIFVIWISYGEIAILSPITNIIFTPLLLGIMYISPISMIFSFVPYLSTILAYIANLFAKAMLFLADYLADYSPLINIDYSFTVYIAVFLVVSLIIIALSNTKKKALYFIPFVVSITAFCICSTIYTNNTKSVQKLVYTNTYAGDCFLVISQNKGMICDISGNSYNSASTAEYYLGKNHITSLEAYLVTEYNDKLTDTLTNLTALTKIKNLYIPSTHSLSEVIIKDELKIIANKNNITIQEYDFSDDNQINFFGIIIDVKNVKHSSDNSPSAFCISFSSHKETYNYFSQSSYSTIDGYSIIIDRLASEGNFIFGSYGDALSIDTFPQPVSNEKRIFFANEDVFAQYSSAIGLPSPPIYLDNGFEFILKH